MITDNDRLLKLNNINNDFEDRYMSLLYTAETRESLALVHYLASSVHSSLDKLYGVTNKLRQAIAAILADLLSIANQPDDQLLYRPRGVADFKGQRIGYRPCIDALNGLVTLGLLHHRPGIWLGSHRQGEGDTARYRAKPALLELALRYGITPGNWRSHFIPAPRPSAMAHPVIVRGKRQFWDKEDKGRKLPIIKTHPAYVAAAEQVNRINAYMAPQLITGCKHDGFIRIFNHGDQDGFAYNMGGRLYSKASGVSYQNMEKHHRHDMRINGEPVVELDLRASFLTILYGLRGIAPDPDIDPYTFGQIPREVIKAWIAMTLGYDRFHSKWSEETIIKIGKEGTDLRVEYCIDHVRAAVIDEHPILQSWPNSPLRWQHLQYHESSAVIDAVETLGLVHDVAALPLHDALLIPSSKVGIASAVLKRAFHGRIGVNPVLAIKTEWTKKSRQRSI
jgi:hypothetical protein